MRIRILGAAAGGGSPQWNCRCANCDAARRGSPDVQPRTQSSVAVSADGATWFLLNVSPDVRQQVIAFPELGPGADGGSGGPRSSRIAGCVLTDAELDHTLGLLSLREGGLPRIFCTPMVRDWLNQYVPLEPILTCFGNPSWSELPLDRTWDLPMLDGAPSGLRLRAFEVDRHVPRFVGPEMAEPIGSVIGLEIEDRNTAGRLVYAPCLASLGSGLRAAARDADCLLVDGTFWSDDEPVRHGIGSRSAREMGHLPVSGTTGSLGWLAELPARHRVYVHINNTNPMVDRNGPEHRLVMDSGVGVGADGDAFEV